MFKTLPEALSIANVVRRVGSDLLLLAGSEFTHHPRWRADNERARRKLLRFRDQCVCSNNGPFADRSAIENYGANPNQTGIADRAAVEHCAVANRRVVADVKWGARITVQDAAILHVAAIANHDRLVVSPHNRRKPRCSLPAQGQRCR
jgi:hypothetical protein